MWFWTRDGAPLIDDLVEKFRVRRYEVNVSQTELKSYCRHDMFNKNIMLGCGICYIIRVVNVVTEVGCTLKIVFYVSCDKCYNIF